MKICMYAGTYSLEGSSLCTSCPIGHYCPNITSDDVRECPEGTFSLGAAAECQSCPAGWQCPTVDGSGNAVCTAVRISTTMQNI